MQVEHCIIEYYFKYTIKQALDLKVDTNLHHTN